MFYMLCSPIAISSRHVFSHVVPVVNPSVVPGWNEAKSQSSWIILPCMPPEACHSAMVVINVDLICKNHGDCASESYNCKTEQIDNHDTLITQLLRV